MKNVFWIIIFSAFLLSKALSQNLPPEILKTLSGEENSQFKLEREKWIDEMHRTEDGVNWKVIEFANSLARKENLMNNMNNIKDGKQSNNLLSEIVAGGNLIGKWIEKGSNNQAGRIHNTDIDWERGFIYAASSGGNIWRGNLDGTGWTCLNNSMKIGNIRAVYVKKISGKYRVFVVGNGPSACYYTENEGSSWISSNGFENASRWGGLHRAAKIDGTDNIYVLANEWDYDKWKAVTTIYKSEDFGTNFTKIYQSNIDVGVCDIYAPRYGKSDLYFVHRDTLTTISQNEVFTDISNFNNLPEFSKATQILIKGSSDMNSGYLAAMLNNGDGSSHFYTSTDGGNNWTKKGSVGFNPFERNSFEVSPSNPDMLFIGGVDTYRSEDGGSTWKIVNGWGEYYGDPKSKLHADIPGIQAFKTPANGELLLIGTDGGLYKSEDFAYTVQNLSLTGLNVSQYYSSYTYRNSQGIVFAGAQDQGFQRCLLDSGKSLSFQQTISGDYGQLSSADGGDNLWAVYPGFAMLYKGANIDKFSSYYWDLNKNNCKNWLWMPPTIGDPSNPQAAYIAAGGINCTDAGKCSYMFHLIYNNGGIIHNILPFNFGTDGSRLSAMAISELNKDYFYALTSNGTFYYSSDKGTSWNKTDSLKGPEAHYFYGSTVLASNKILGKVIIAGSGYSNPAAFVSYNNGKDFAKIDSGLPKTLIYKIAVSDDEKYIFAATEAGQYIYIDAQKKWFSLASLSSPDQTFWSVEYLPQSKTARFVTYGRGIWDFKIEEEVSVNEICGDEQNLSLSAYPVPAADWITIRAKALKSGPVKIVIYDMEGRIINNLNANHPSFETEKEIRWNCTDFAGNKVKKGSYLCIMTSEGVASFCKIIIE